MKTIKASEFKARCLQLMSEVAETGDVIVITKNGRPMAQLGHVILRPTTLSGAHEGKIVGGVVAPMDEPWDVECSLS